MIRIFLCLVFISIAIASSAQYGDTVVVEAEGRAADQQDWQVESEEDYETIADSSWMNTIDEDTAVASYSTTDWSGEDIRVKKFDKDKWNKIVNGEKFQETELEEEEKTERKDAKQREAISEAKPWDNTWIKIIMYISVAAAIGVVIYYLLNNLGKRGEVKLNRVQVNPVVTEIDDIESLDVRSLLERAKAEGNYRIAIRLYYLNLLKTLNDGGMIRWKKDKTNREYLSELFLANFFYNEIRNLTLSYEEVWYGEHSLTQDALQRIILDFDTVNSQVNSSIK